VKRIKAASVLALAIWLAHWSANGDLLVAAQRVDSLVMVTNRDNLSVSKMSKTDAKKLLLGQTISWPNGGRVLIILRTMGSGDRAAVLQGICGMSEAEYTRHNLQATFMGETVASVVEGPSATAIKSFVKSNPGALGFLHASELDDSVKAVWPVE
jgi:ABC-type phosphate transport system substrate-binding protein